MESNDTDAKEGAKSQDSSGEAKERTNNLVAITVAVLAVFMGVTKVTDDNVCQRMERVKADALNKWNHYQSKSVKQNVAKVAGAQLTGLAGVTTGDTLTRVEAKLAYYDAEIARYEKEMTEIRIEAEEHDRTYIELNLRDDQFDTSDAALSVALGMLAVTALTGQRRLLIVSWAVGGVGAFWGMVGLFKLDIHPGWLVNFLS